MFYTHITRAAFARKQRALKPSVLALAVLFASQALAEETNIDLAAVPVTGNPLGVSSDDLVVPVSVLNGRELSLRRESTLGETLNGIPGVTATQFGPNASRPVIRGLDAERVKIMQNGIGILDASSLSFDHAVGVDPLIIEQIDVVRGPAALLYGGSAMGGVVNAIDHRIPTEKLDGIVGRAETRFGGADSTRNAAAVIDIGNGIFAIHGDVYNRKSDDLDIPGFAVSSRKSRADGTPRENKGKLVNSSAEGDGGALGASLTFDKGYIGLSYSILDSNYGVVAEEEVRIDMNSNRWELASEFKELDFMLNRVKFRMAHTDYEHQELEGAEVGTTFTNRGLEGSLEAGHRPIFGLNGVLGYQFSNTNFAALGEEAFVPNVNTQNKALYLYEELPLGNADRKHKLTFGGRLGHTTVDSKNSAVFGAGQNNSFNPNSFALGGLYNINPYWSLTSNLSHNERAPSYFELYANGAHIATGQFEVGNNDFDKEKSNGIDAQIRWKDAKNSFSIGAYYTRFSNFIGLFDTGSIDAISNLPIAQFSAVPATFKGLEAEGKFNIASHWDLSLRGDYVLAKDTRSNDDLPRIAPLRLGAGLQSYYTRFSNFIGLFDTGNIDAGSGLPIAQFSAVPASFKGLEAEGKFNITDNWDLSMRGDYVLAKDTRSNDDLPRIAPLRLGAGLQYAKGAFSAKLDVLRAFKQNNTADNELVTDGYTNVSAIMAYKLGGLINTGKLNIELFAKANNLLDDEIREHASFLKDIAPAGERSVLIGARADF